MAIRSSARKSRKRSISQDVSSRKALKINMGGGTATFFQAERDVRTEQLHSTTNEAGRNSMGNGTIRKESLRGRTGWRRANLNGQTPVPENSWGGWYSTRELRRINRFRRQLLGKEPVQQTEMASAVPGNTVHDQPPVLQRDEEKPDG